MNTKAKKLLSLIFAMLILLSVVPITASAAETVASGKCGDNLTWTLDTDGTLTVSGTGKMYNFADESENPWYDNRTAVKKVVIGDRVTHIGTYAFYGCSALESIEMNSVTHIGVGAFAKCETLKTVYVGKLQSVNDPYYENAIRAFAYSHVNDVYYDGSVADWYKINMNYGAGCNLFTADNVHFAKEATLKYSKGDLIYFGSFPKTEVTDSDVVSQLNADKENRTYVYDSYKDIYYAETKLNGEKYRARLDSENENATNWYKYEPLAWSVLDHVNGLVVALDVVDGRGYGAGSFANSDLREWLNSDFYTQAFTAQQQSKIKTTVIHNDRYYDNTMIAIPAEDSTECIFMPSYSDLSHSLYDRQWQNSVSLSDYAKAVEAATYYLWSRTACNYPNYFSYSPLSKGYFNTNTGAEYGVLPMMYIDIENVDCEHILQKSVTLPDCVSEGYTVYTCDCGYSYITDKAAATGHNYKSVITTPATHLTDGIETFTCDCGDSYTKTIAKLEAYTELYYVYTVYDGKATIVDIDKSIDDLVEECAELTIPSTLGGYPVVAIGESGFNGVELAGFSIIIPDSVTSIGDYAFSGTDIFYITIPDSVSYIGKAAFASCNYLHNVTIPAAVTTIEERTFANCDWLESITFLGDITSIGDNAITYSAIKSVNLPASLVSIGDGAFYFNSNLSNVYYAASEDEWNAIAIGDNNYSLLNAKIHFNHPTPDAHTYNNITITAPTCTKRGYSTYRCECGVSYNTDYTDATGHTYYATSESVTAPTCTEQGYTTLICKCGDTYIIDYTAPTGHSHEGKVTKEATHTATGVMTYTCHCGDSYTTDIPKLADAHDYKAVVTAPTCTNQGYTTYTCVCGDTYVADYTSATGHSHTGKVTTEATHTADGVKTYTCHCGDTYTEYIPKLAEHTYKKTVTAPTCTEQGYTTYTCECGDTYAVDYTAATGHSHTGKVTKEATHTDGGVKTYTCHCGDTYTEVIPKLVNDHNYKAVVTAPTCTKQGYTTYTCVCGDSYVADYKDATGHSHTGKVTKAATHTATGIKTYTCKCGDTYTETIDRIAEHSYKAKVTKAATHLAEGVKTYTCECGDTYTEVIPKTTKHDYDWEVIEEPDCTHEGLREYTCECGHSYTESIPAKGHKDKDGDILCDECGTSYCSHLCHKGGIMGVVWKILRFFWELFGMNPVCECGMAHY